MSTLVHTMRQIAVILSLFVSYDWINLGTQARPPHVYRMGLIWGTTWTKRKNMAPKFFYHTVKWKTGPFVTLKVRKTCAAFRVSIWRDVVLRTSKEARGIKKKCSLWFSMFPLCSVHDIFIIHSSTGGCVISCFPATVVVVWITGMQSLCGRNGIIWVWIWSSTARHMGIHLFLQFWFVIKVKYERIMTFITTYSSSIHSICERALVFKIL